MNPRISKMVDKLYKVFLSDPWAFSQVVLALYIKSIRRQIGLPTPDDERPVGQED